MNYVTEITADLLDFPEDITIIVHQANTLNVFGAGIAAQIKRRYPEAYAADTKAAKENKNKLGSFSVGKVRNDLNKYVVNLYGQDHITRGIRNTNYEALFSALEAVYRSSSMWIVGYYRIGIPYGMGCGLAGGDWPIVEAMIRVLAERYKIYTLICKLPT